MNAIVLCAMMFGQAAPTADEVRLLKQVTEFRTRRLAEYDAIIEKTANSRTRNKLKNVRKKFDESGMLETFYPADFKTGRLGYLSGGWGNDRYLADNTFRVSQVIDPLNMIVESPDDYGGTFLDNTYRNMKTVRFFVSGLSTKDVIDGSFIQLPQLFEIVGTKTYTTVLGGSSTIYEIRPFPIQDIESFMKTTLEKFSAMEEAKALPEKPAEPFRAFSDATGKFKVEARFLSYGSGSVTLEKTDGSKVKVPMERLSEADQKWINEEIERRKK